MGGGGGGREGLGGNCAFTLDVKEKFYRVVYVSATKRDDNSMSFAEYYK